MKLSDMNPATMRGPGDDEPVDEVATCSVCDRTVPIDFFVGGYLFPTCDDCDEAICTAEQEKAEDGQ